MFPEIWGTYRYGGLIEMNERKKRKKKKRKEREKRGTYSVDFGTKLNCSGFSRRKPTCRKKFVFVLPFFSLPLPSLFSFPSFRFPLSSFRFPLSSFLFPRFPKGSFVSIGNWKGTGIKGNFDINVFIFILFNFKAKANTTVWKYQWQY